MKTTVLYSATLLTLLSAASVQSSDHQTTINEDGSYHIKLEGKKDSKQYCYTDFWLERNGDWKAHTKFSNGKRIDGDHFQAILSIKTHGDKAGVAIKHVAGMRRTHTHGGSFERVVDSNGHSDHLKPTDLDRASYTCSLERDQVPDEEIAKAVISAVLKL